MAVLIKKPYNRNTISELENYLLERASAGTPVQYSVFVDNFQVIAKTSDPLAFVSHEKHITKHSKKLVFHEYRGASNICKKTIFEFQPTPIEDLESLLEQEVNAQRQILYLKQEIKALKKQLKKSKKKQRKRLQEVSLRIGNEKVKINLQEVEDTLNIFNDIFTQNLSFNGSSN